MGAKRMEKVTPPKEAIAKHVVIIGIDGLGSHNITSDKIRGRIPSLDFIKNNGAWTHKAYIDRIAISAPNWQGSLTGSSSKLHGVLKNKCYRGKNIPTIFDLFYNQKKDSEMGMIFDWDVIGCLSQNRGKFKESYHPATEDNQSIKAIGKDTADYILEKRPALIFTYFGAADEAGHHHSGRSDEYANAIIQIDKEVGNILDALKEADILDETLVIVTSDHGHMRGIKAHSTRFKPVPLYIMGPKIKKGEMKHVSRWNKLTLRNNLVAPLAAHYLGLKQPLVWQNSVLPLLPYIQD